MLTGSVIGGLADATETGAVASGAGSLVTTGAGAQAESDTARTRPAAEDQKIRIADNLPQIRFV
jgi:hypothetical protein